MVILALLILTIVVIFDLSQSHSLLASFFQQSTSQPGKGERLRDDLLDQINPRR